MKKIISTNLKAYTFDNERRGAKYSFDGEHFNNNGEFSEAQLKHVLGFEAVKDANTAFDEGSDIEELQMSVKSSKASLTSEILGKDLETSLNTYFERTASNQWSWVIIMDGTLTAYVMDANEFREFTQIWANYSERKVIRYKATSGKMIKWFEERD